MPLDLCMGRDQIFLSGIHFQTQYPRPAGIFLFKFSAFQKKFFSYFEIIEIERRVFGSALIVFAHFLAKEQICSGTGFGIDQVTF